LPLRGVRSPFTASFCHRLDWTGPHLASLLRHTSCKNTTPVHKTHLRLVISCMCAWRITEMRETTLQAKSPGDVKWLEALPERRMWHFKVELLRLGLQLSTPGIANAWPRKQTNQGNPQSSSGFHTTAYHLGRIRVQAPDTWWHTVLALATANQRCIRSWAEDQTGPASIRYASDAICIACRLLVTSCPARNLVWFGQSCARERVWADDDTIAARSYS
jgi:hypothetical protein